MLANGVPSFRKGVPPGCRPRKQLAATAATATLPKDNACAAMHPRLAQASSVSRWWKVYGALILLVPGMIRHGGFDTRPQTPTFWLVQRRCCSEHADLNIIKIFSQNLVVRVFDFELERHSAKKCTNWDG